MLRAWKVRVAEGVERAAREAAVRERQTGLSMEGGAGAGGAEDGAAGERASLVAAIRVSNEASNLSSFCGGYDSISSVAGGGGRSGPDCGGSAIMADPAGGGGGGRGRPLG